MEGLSKGLYPIDMEPLHTWAVNKTAHNGRLLAKLVYVAGNKVDKPKHKRGRPQKAKNNE